MASRNRRLARARKVRRVVARDVEQLKEGVLTLPDVLNDPRLMKPCRLWTVLMATPRLGEKGVKRLCEAANVWPETRMQDLSTTERERLLDHLPTRVK